MSIDLRETRLPGVGVKYAFQTAHGGRIAMILHIDGIAGDLFLPPPAATRNRRP